MSKPEVRLLAVDLEVGQSITRECPWCKRNKLSITRNEAGGLLYNCYRASCGERGFIPTDGVYEKPERKAPKLKPYWGEKLPIKYSDAQYFYRRFGIQSDTAQEYIWVTDNDEYLLPICDPYGRERGYVQRQPVWKGDPAPVRGGRPDYPKARTWMHAQGPTQAWYHNDNERVVIVEDQISGIAVMQAGLTCVALLGTHLDQDKVREIASVKPQEVIIALDADATNEALKLARKWGLAFKRTRVAILARDLKEECTDDIPEILL